jgi:hypothetical protein
VIRHYKLHQGYVEDQSLVCMEVYHTTGFESGEEAMEHFYGVLLKVARMLVPAPKECCQKTFEAHPKARFCMTCGFRKGSNGDPEKVALEVWDAMWRGDWDSLSNDGMDVYEDFESAGWCWGSPGPNDPVVVCCRVERFFDRYDGEPEDDIVTMGG